MGSYTCMAVNNIGDREIGTDQTSTMLTIIGEAPDDVHHLCFSLRKSFSNKLWRVRAVHL